MRFEKPLNLVCPFVFLLLAAIFLFAADEKTTPAKALNDADKVVALKQVTAILATETQIQNLSSQIGQLQQQASQQRATYEKLLTDFRKKYGAADDQNLNLDAEWTPPPVDPKKPPEEAKKK